MKGRGLIMNQENDYWNYALEVFKHLGSPLRPEPTEISFMQQQVRHWVAAHPGRRPSAALVLGVTEEIVAMQWPDAVAVTAVDESASMIGAFWPGDIPGRRKLIRGNWFDFPAEAQSFDLILGDGVFNIPDFPLGYAKLAQRIHSLLRPEGVMIVRVFTQLENKETPEDIIAEIKSTAHFDYWSMRYRFITSLQTSVQTGIYSGTLPTNRALEKYGVSADEFIARTNHKPIPMPDLPPEGMEGLQINFPTENQFAETLAALFQVTQVGYGQHPLARRCPIYCLTPL
jgi:SAM-dependent methyltransferase